MRNFMTYKDCELRPGPNLNMIVGPNGTGKSTVVCAIIVGLAGNVTKTGRATDAAGFVKKGTDVATTEIELFNNRGSNYIIEREITIVSRNADKIETRSEWKLNRKKTNVTRIRELTEELSIKVDNLCQFLPQDSVTNFVKMDTRELLTNTLEAVGDNKLVEDHKKLIDGTKEIGEKKRALDNLKKQCQENEMNARRLEDEVNLMQRRDQLVKDRNICEQKIHFVRYSEAKDKYDVKKQELTDLQTELRSIENSAEPYKRGMELYQEEEKKFEAQLKDANNERSRLSRSYEEILTQVESRKISWQEENSKFKSKQDREERRAGEIRLKQQDLESHECRLNDIREADYSKEIKEAEHETGKIRHRLKECNDERAHLEDRKRDNITQMEQARNDHNQVLAVSEKRKNLLASRNMNAYKVFEWLQQNQQRFREKIFPPMLCEINVKERRNADIVEHAIPTQELFAFVCQNEADLKMFTELVYDRFKFRINVILAPEKSVDDFERETLSQYSDLGAKLGIDVTYMKDLIEAPEPIIRYLCGSFNFHRIPVVSKCPESKLAMLMKICPRFYVDKTFYLVQKSKFDQQTITTSDKVGDAYLLQYSLDTKRLAEVLKMMEAIRVDGTRLEEQQKELNKKHDAAKQDWQIWADRLREYKSKEGEKQRLEIVIKQKRTELENLSKEKIDIEAERIKLQKSIEKINTEVVHWVERLADNQLSFANNKSKVFLATRLREVASFNHKIARRLYHDAQISTSRLKEEVRRLDSALVTYKRNMDERAADACEKIPGFKKETGRLEKSTLRKFETIQENTTDELQTKIEGLNVQIRSISRDRGIITEYQRQNEELRDRRSRIEQLEASIKTILDATELIRTEWRQQVDEVISVVNKNYQEFMLKLGYEGRVKLDYNLERPEDYNAYGIQILVKYRDDEQLNPLSSIRQSGGERSVATMIYMLALQTKTTVPFRCVDEINQGMDAENERKVFELLVKTADLSSSQYFLVSPKLLLGLTYTEKMVIHTVFSGKKLKLAWYDLLGPPSCAAK